MNASTPAYGQAVFEIIGFDRIQFVSDVLEAVSRPGQSRIAHVAFEADGVRTAGQFTVQVDDRQQLDQIARRLRNIRGLVQLTQLPVTT